MKGSFRWLWAWLGATSLVLGMVIGTFLYTRWSPNSPYDIYFIPESPWVAIRYIPADLDDAHFWLERNLPAAEIARIRAFPDEDEMSTYHFGLGSGIRNIWQLGGEGRISSWFHDRGIHHPDDMSGIILDTFWCRLHGQPYRLEERIAFYQDYWNRMNVPEGLRSPVDDAPIAFSTTYFRVDAEGNERTLHVGESQSDGSEWVWEYGTGLYPMTDEARALLKSKKW